MCPACDPLTMTSQCHNYPLHLLLRPSPAPSCPGPTSGVRTYHCLLQLSCSASHTDIIQSVEHLSSRFISANMSTDSLLSSTTTSSFTGDIDSYLDKIGSKAPQSWRKPRSRIYDHNRTLGHEYYQVRFAILWKSNDKCNPTYFFNFFLSILIIWRCDKSLKNYYH